MAKFARIDADIVRETAECDSIAGRFHPSLTWFECPPECREGWRLVGGELVAPDDYRAQRLHGSPCYAPLADQLDMQFKDAQDGGSRWVDHIAAVKAAWPKP